MQKQLFAEAYFYDPTSGQVLCQVHYVSKAGDGYFFVNEHLKIVSKDQGGIGKLYPDFVPILYIKSKGQKKISLVGKSLILVDDKIAYMMDSFDRVKAEVMEKQRLLWKEAKATNKSLQTYRQE